MKRLIITLGLTISLALGSFGVGWSGDFQKGMKAYKNGDYATALKEWKPLAEAGDTLWLDNKTLIIGRGFRTNPAGIQQITEILSPKDITIHIFDLPTYLGESSCLHLMSLISLVNSRSALVFRPLLPVGLLELLIEKQVSLIEAPVLEFERSNTLSTNVLATSPGKCIMLDSVPNTRLALEKNKIQVKVFNGDSLCIGCQGGPTCLTRPILREH